MMRFGLGFACALAASAAAYWLVLREPDPAGVEPCAGLCGRGTRCDGARCVAAAGDGPAPEPERRGKRGRRRGAARRDRPAGDVDTDDRGISDDMDLDPQQIDMEHGGERQLSNTTIEATMDRSFGSIRRCILAAQSDREEPVHGRMSVGIRIRPTGQVGAVTVRPPPALAGTDLVPCVRSAVSRIRFPSFDGREMVVTYPVTLD